MFESSYVLITALYNEADYIGNTIESVLMQTIKPKRWIIVSDGSTDTSDVIVKEYASKHHFIEFIRREKASNAPGFISKVLAIRLGYSTLVGQAYRYIGILDADITFKPDYYENILSRFHNNALLGIAGGFIYELQKGQFENRPTNTRDSVAGGIQLFRRECYEAIGGHSPARFGGEDWICEITARMCGWQVEAFPDVVAYHHKPGTFRRGALREAIREGRMDYSVGSHPFFELAKCLRRIWQPPCLVGSLVRYASFIAAALRGDEKALSKDAIAFLRSEQLMRLKNIV